MLACVLALGSAANAQDAPGDRANDPPAADAPVAGEPATDGDGPGLDLDVPAVDTIDMVPPEQRLVELTLGLYEAVDAWSGTCDQMWRPVRTYLDEHEDEISLVASTIAEAAATMSQEEIQALADYFGGELLGHPTARSARDALYPCLRSTEVQGKGRPLDKEMDRFFRMQRPMIDAIIGNVD